MQNWKRALQNGSFTCKKKKSSNSKRALRLSRFCCTRRDSAPPSDTTFWATVLRLSSFEQAFSTTKVSYIIMYARALAPSVAGSEVRDTSNPYRADQQKGFISPVIFAARSVPLVLLLPCGQCSVPRWKAEQKKSSEVACRPNLWSRISQLSNRNKMK